jgi:DNA ligase (NAD+)
VINGKYLFCFNDDCPAQVAGGIRRWCERLELKGWGPALIEALCEAGWVNDASDLYALDPDKLATLEMAGRKVGDTAYIVMSELRTKTEVTLDVLVGSMGIPNCERSITRMLMAAGYDDLDKLEAMTAEEAEAVPGMGPVRADIFTENLPAKMPIIRRLLGAGIRLKTKNQIVGVLTGKTVCLTGFRDKELSAAVEAAGGTMKDSVGKGLTYLVAKDPNSGSGKLQKAQKDGTLVVSIDDMWAIVRGQN